MLFINRMHCFATVFICLVILSFSDISAEVVPLEAYDAARDYLKKLTESLQNNAAFQMTAIRDMKLESIDDLSYASIGKPYRTIRISYKNFWI